MDSRAVTTVSSCVSLPGREFIDVLVRTLRCTGMALALGAGGCLEFIPQLSAVGAETARNESAPAFRLTQAHKTVWNEGFSG